MTNPNNAVGTNGAFGGRTSVNAFNDGLAAYSSGILSGWACSPDTGLTVVLGGDGNTRDVAIAEDNAGNKTTINNISGSPISVTVGNAPSTNSRIDSIVAYVDNPPTGSSTATDNYGACGLIVVSGTVASSPTPPTDSTIRTAITADGASGTTAYYVVIANITIPNGTTTLTTANISSGDLALIGQNNLDMTAIYKTLFAGAPSSSVTISETANNFDSLIVFVKDPGYAQVGSAILTGANGGICFGASGSGYLHQIIANIGVSGTTVSLSQSFVISLSGNSSNPTITYGSSGATIQKVIGVKHN